MAVFPFEGSESYKAVEASFSALNDGDVPTDFQKGLLLLTLLLVELGEVKETMQRIEESVASKSGD